MIMATVLTSTVERARSTCRCGHERDRHEHFRTGSDCSACGPHACGRFTALRRRRRISHRRP